MDSAEKTQKSFLSDTNESEEEEATLEYTLRVLGDVAVEIESGAQVEMKHPSDFYYQAADEVEELKKTIKELEIMLDGAKRGIDRYIYGPIEIMSEDGELITTIDEWVSRELIDGAIKTYVLKGIARGTNYADGE